MIAVVEAGCAECRGPGDDEPLIRLHEFLTVKGAKAWAKEQLWISGGREVTWLPHPQGGEHVVVGQGSVWILP